MATKTTEKATLAKQVVETILTEKPRAEAVEVPRILYTIRIEQRHVDTLKAAAAEQGITHAELARRILYDFIIAEKAKKPAPAAKKAPVKKAVAK